MQAVEWLEPRGRNWAERYPDRSRLPLAYNPLMPALYRSVRAGVKKHSIFVGRKVVGLNDLKSAEKGIGRWGCRPLVGMG